jgi:hypothetical protein
MLNISGHKGNANQNYTEIPPYPSQNGYHQQHKQQAGEDMGKKEFSYTANGNVKISTITMESNRKSLKK